MAKVPQKYKVTVHYNPQPDLAKLARGYEIIVKVAIRIVEQRKVLEPDK